MNIVHFDENDLARLERLLKPLSEAGTTMRPDEVQAFFIALASGPDELDSRFWLPEVLGDAPRFENAKDEAEALKLLNKFYRASAEALAAGHAPKLILYPEDDTDELDYWSWCNAYLYAFDSIPTDCFERANDEYFDTLMLPIMVLGGLFDELNGEDSQELKVFNTDDLAEFKQDLPNDLLAIYTYWQAK